MRLSTALADEIVKKTVELTQLHINVMNKEGFIISSSDPERIHTFHEGAHRVITNGKDLLISPEEHYQLAGTKPGINMPIYFQQEIIGVIGISGQPEEVIPFGKGVKMMTEMLLQQFYLMEQLEADERSKDYLLQEIISGALNPVLEGVLARGELVGIDLTQNRSIMLIEIQGSEETLLLLDQSPSRLKKLSTLFHQPQQTLISKVRRNRWLILTELSAYKDNGQAKKHLLELAHKMVKALTEWIAADIIISLGNAYDNVYDLKHSFNEAVQVLDIMKQYPNKGSVQHIDDVALELILHHTPELTKRLMIREYLGDLVHYKDLLETLQALYSCNLNLSLTSATLKIHKNTLLYRLERIEEILGFNPRLFQHAIRVHLALLLLHN